MVFLDTNVNSGINDFTLVRDFVIKEIFSKNPTIYKNFLILLLNDVIKLDSKNTTISFENGELGKSCYREYNKIVDSYIKLNNNIHINLECNTSKYENVMLINILYLNKTSTKILESGNKTKVLNDIYLIQININTSKNDSDFGYDIFNYVGKKCNKKLTNFQNILIYNIEYYRNLFYNGGEKLTKAEMWLVVLSSRNFKELFNTLGYVVNKYEKNKLIKDVINMFSDGFRLCDWEKEKLIELERAVTIQNAKRDGLRMGKRQGLKEGRAEGFELGIISTIKSMIKKNFTPEIISEITGKSIKEIENIQKSIV